MKKRTPRWVLEEPVHAVARAAVAAAQNEEVSARGDQAVALDTCVSGVQPQGLGACSGSHVEGGASPGRGFAVIQFQRRSRTNDFFENGLQIHGRFAEYFAGAIGQDNSGFGDALIG